VRTPFCPHCGQDRNTRRFDAKHLARALSRALFTVDNTFVTTLARLLAAPGHLAREYVLGKRAKYVTPFTLLAVLTLVDGYVRNHWRFNLAETADDQVRAVVHVLEETRRAFEKLFIIALLPLQALTTSLWFRRARQNYAEHFIMNLFVACTNLVCAVVASAVVASFGLDARSGMKVVNAGSLAGLAYAVATYRQYYAMVGYSRAGLILRSLGAALSLYFAVTLSAIAYVLAIR
jgi:hypothetical protein